MRPRSTQFGARENTASSRQHASRFTVPSTISEFSAEHYAGSPAPQAFGRAALRAELEHPFHAALERAATAGKENYPDHLLSVREVADLLQVPASWVYGRMRKRSLGPLPAYRLGKYWRFNRDEVLDWVERQRHGSHAA